MTQISVIVLTYNPDNAKLRRTLAAAAAQQDVTMEVIISDDGSANKDFSFLPEYMASLGVADYRLLEHPVNRGTVQSCLSAVREARGEYVFLTSPGDYLYDPRVLCDLYRFARENKQTLCFGNAVFYNAEGDRPVLTRQVGVPAAPTVFDYGQPKKDTDTAFFGGSWVIGATYFRQRQLALACLEDISGEAKYMEDTPSTMFALARGESLCHIDRNMVWYEDGTGVSTGASEKWEKLLHEDLLACLKKLKNQFPKDPFVDLAYLNVAVPNRWLRLVKKLVKHPLLVLRVSRGRRAEAAPIVAAPEAMAYLENLLKTK